MFDYRQYMSAPQQMVSGPTRGDELRRMVIGQAEQAEADKKIAAETARRESREDAIRAEDRAYYETKEANDRSYYEQQDAKRKAEDDARYALEQSSYQSAMANQSAAAVNPQSSGSFSPSSSPPPSPSPTPSALPAATNELKGRDKRAANRAEMSVGERREAQSKSGLSMQDFKAGYRSLKNA